MAKRLKREAKEEEYLPEELVARVDVSEEEEQPEKGNDLDPNSDSEDSGSEDEEECEITDSEDSEQVQANTSALEILVASCQKHGAFDRTYAYQRGPEPSERTLQASSTQSS